MKHITFQRTTVLITLLVSTLFVSGCSSSSDSGNAVSNASLISDIVQGEEGESNDSVSDSSSTTSDQTLNETSNSNDNNNATDSTSEMPTSSTPNTVQPQTTRVSFDITVPEYMSDALQVSLVWGDKSSNASWNVDETWTVVDDFPTNTLNPLVVTFSDDNGALVLGSVETEFETGTNASESVQVTADQFDTAQFDSDQDGISNLDELIAGDNPLLATTLPKAVDATLSLVVDKTFRISWTLSQNAESYRVLENEDGVSGFSDISGELGASTTSFDHRVALFARANAQYLVQACNDDGCVDSETLFVTGTLANAVGYFKASTLDLFDGFGESVSLSADGNTMAVGASREDSAATGINGDQTSNTLIDSGAVYVFERINGLWQQQAYIKAVISHPRFGHSVSLSADGNTLAIGGNERAYVYSQVNGVWQSVYNPVNGSGELSVVALSADGNTLAFNVDGEIRVSILSNGFWSEQAILPASFASRNFSVNELSLSANGNTLAIGWNHRFRVYARSNGQWQDQTNPSVLVSGISFGQFVSVGLSADGNTLAIGAQGDRSAATGIGGNELDQSASDSGAAFIFARSDGLWQQSAYIKASNTETRDSFGASVSLSADGNTLAVGASRVGFSGENSAATGINGDQSDNSEENSGAVYVFTSNSGSWQQQAFVKASNTQESDFFGSALSLSADGKTLAVGANGEDSSSTGINAEQGDNSVSGSGAVYLY